MSVTAAPPPKLAPTRISKEVGGLDFCKNLHSTHKAEALPRGGLSSSLSPTQEEGLPAPQLHPLAYSGSPGGCKLASPGPLLGSLWAERTTNVEPYTDCELQAFTEQLLQAGTALTPGRSVNQTDQISPCSGRGYSQSCWETMKYTKNASQP